MRRGLVLALLLAFGWSPLSAAELQVFCAGAAKGVMERLADPFASASGHRLVFAFDTVGALRDRVAAGAAADAVILTEAALRELASRGHVSAEGLRGLGRIGVAVGVRRGEPLPDISTPDALRRTLLEARSIAYADPARGATAGKHFAAVLDRLGIAAEMKPKTVLVPFGVEGIARAARGEVELAISQASEIVANPGAALAGGLPAELQLWTVYAIAPAAAGAPGNRAAAAALVAFLGGPDGLAALRDAGFDPP